MNSIELTYEAGETTWHRVHELLRAAAEAGNQGPVAHHIVGAALQLTCGNLKVPNVSYRSLVPGLGNYQVNDALFHVITAPTLGGLGAVFSESKQGIRVFILLPDQFAVGATQVAEMTSPGRVAVESIESFVAQIIERLGGFSLREVHEEWRRLVGTYDYRVVEVEASESLRIEMIETDSEQCSIDSPQLCD